MIISLSWIRFSAWWNFLDDRPIITVQSSQGLYFHLPYWSWVLSHLSSPDSLIGATKPTPAYPLDISTSTKPFNSFREIKVSVTIRYGSRLRRGFWVISHFNLWRTLMSIISISRCPSSPVHLSSYYHWDSNPFHFTAAVSQRMITFCPTPTSPWTLIFSQNLTPLWLPLL